MSTTDYLFDKAKGIIERKPEISDASGKYTMADDGGVECEVGELLYGFTRALKPQAVLTTGIYTGVSDMYIGQALVDNGLGTSDALEYERQHIERAKKLWQQVGVAHVINEHLTSSLDFTPNRNYDFIFLDTEPQIRFAELERFYPYLNDGGFMAIHDCPRTMCQGNINPDHPEMKSYPFGDIPRLMGMLLNSGRLIKFHFPTPRGLVFFYKPHQSDHKA